MKHETIRYPYRAYQRHRPPSFGCLLLTLLAVWLVIVVGLGLVR